MIENKKLSKLEIKQTYYSLSDLDKLIRTCSELGGDIYLIENGNYRYGLMVIDMENIGYKSIIIRENGLELPCLKNARKYNKLPEKYRNMLVGL